MKEVFLPFVVYINFFFLLLKLSSICARAVGIVSFFGATGVVLRQNERKLKRMAKNVIEWNIINYV